MFANRRFAVSVLLAASLGAGAVTDVAGCGGSSPAAAPVTTSAVPPAAAAPSESEQPKISQAALQNVVSCMKSHGICRPSHGWYRRGPSASTPLPR
jgi:hypothetical protein